VAAEAGDLGGVGRAGGQLRVLGCCQFGLDEGCEGDEVHTWPAISAVVAMMAVGWRWVWKLEGGCCRPEVGSV